MSYTCHPSVYSTITLQESVQTVFLFSVMYMRRFKRIHPVEPVRSGRPGTSETENWPWNTYHSDRDWTRLNWEHRVRPLPRFHLLQNVNTTRNSIYNKSRQWKILLTEQREHVTRFLNRFLVHVISLLLTTKIEPIIDCKTRILLLTEKLTGIQLYLENCIV